jgi:hypothetical protein
MDRTDPKGRGLYGVGQGIEKASRLQDEDESACLEAQERKTKQQDT